MSYKKKSWKEQLEDDKNFPKTLTLESNFPCYRALQKMGAKLGDSVVLAPPLEVDAIMQQVPEGQLITLRGICERLAKNHQTQYCCTLTTGIFVNIVANATEEMNRAIPYWRTVKNDGQLNVKFPGGADDRKNCSKTKATPSSHEAGNTSNT